MGTLTRNGWTALIPTVGSWQLACTIVDELQHGGARDSQCDMFNGASLLALEAKPQAAGSPWEFFVARLRAV